MVYRAAAICIVLFWLTMTALLVRKEARPEDSSLREIPVSHVVKLLFLHEQTSDLNIISDKLRLGRLQIQPRVDKETASRVVEFSGQLHLPIPGGARQRVGWNGKWEMEDSFATRRFQLGLTMYVPTEIRGEVVIVPADNRAHCEIRGSSGIIEQQDFPLNESGFYEVLHSLGVDRALISSASIHINSAPKIKAFQSSMKIHGGQIATYRVSVEQNDQTLLEIHVSQLGQILWAKTFLGHTLAPDDLAP